MRPLRLPSHGSIPLRALLFTSFSLLFASPAAQAQRRATTEDGKKVLLFDDGTWRSAESIKLTMPPVVLPAPPWKGHFGLGHAKRTIRLRRISAQKNTVTDTKTWFQKNGLTLPTYEVPNSFRHIKGNCPQGTPSSYRKHKLISAIRGAKHLFLVYGKNFSSGRFLVITDLRLTQVQKILDFKNYLYGPRDKPTDKRFVAQSITWATIRDGVLYVSHGHRTYAKSSGGLNAYVTAINLKTYQIFWRSKPLVCNARNFTILDDIIVCGYGFTAEPDFLITIDRETGKTLKKIRLKTGPDYILRKGNRLYVRTYNMDYVFRIRGRSRR